MGMRRTLRTVVLVGLVVGWLILPFALPSDGQTTPTCRNDAEATYATGGAYRYCVMNRPASTIPR